MKVSVNWVKELTKVDLSINELVEKIGSQLGAVDEVIDLGKNYKGILVVKVVACEKHPNATKLSVCLVDDGGKSKNVARDKDGLIQIVCGAPNVKVGMMAVWIPPGVVVPATAEKDPFVIESREIRGQMSHGMMASPKELDLGNSHDGLLVVDSSAKPGESLSKIYGLDDYIIDIENKMFTHRPDCFGMLGVAREIAGIQGHKFVSPDWYQQDLTIGLKNSVNELKLQVKNEILSLVPRFMAIAIKDVEVKPSPTWLQNKLMSVGLKPINNVVDVTNYLMLLTAQPLHAYDYDKLSTGEIGVRLSKNGENLKLLGGKTIELTDGSIVITDGKNPIGLGGVMGGADTEVDGSTKNIILECANFDMNKIRKTAMQYGIFSDAATRFTKNQSPLQNKAVIIKAINEIISVAGGGLASDLIDETGKLPGLPMIKVGADFINNRLGVQLSVNDIKNLLDNVEFKTSLKNEQIFITPPFWRTDIAIAEDVVEEVGRLYGYDNLVPDLPKRSLAPAKANAEIELQKKIRGILSRAGANEVLTYSFVHGSLLQKVGQDPVQAYRIRNALSPDLQYYRLSLTPSLLEKIHPNIKLGYEALALFEIGKSHNKSPVQKRDKSNIAEFSMLSLVVAASKKQQPKSAGAAFFQARNYLDFLATQLGLKLTYKPILKQEVYQAAKPFELARSAQVWSSGSKVPLGVVGEYTDEVINNLKLPMYSAGFEIDVDQLLQILPKTSSYQPLSRYPKIQQDISLVVAVKHNYAQVINAAELALHKFQPKDCSAELQLLNIYQGDDNHKTITLRLSITAYDRTLTTLETNTLLQNVTAEVKKQLAIKP